MKNLLIIAMLFACSLTSSAQTFFTVDNVRYLLENDQEGESFHAVVARQDRELDGNISIPATVTYDGIDYAVTRLLSPSDGESGGGGAFQECGITSITLPERITEIPDKTFMQCKQLSSVTLQGPVTRIGDYAFSECEALAAIALPDDVIEMGEAAFRGAGLTEFKIPTGVTCLSYGVLADTKITYLEIPAAINTLHGLCFAANKTDGQGQPLKRTVKMYQRDCRSIIYDGNAFGDMTTVDLLVPAGGKVVYQEYFPWLNMKSITEYGENSGEALVPDQRHVTIDGIRYLLKNGKAYVDIQPETLSGEVSIPKQVTYEGDGIVYPVTGVTEAEGHMVYYDYYKPNSVLSKTQVTKIVLPSSIQTIGNYAFQCSPYLKEVVLNEGVTTIGELAFSNSPELTTINIPSTMQILPNAIFWGCHKLTTITLNEGITSLEWEALWDTGIETLTIPSTCTNLSYRTLAIPNLKTLIMKVKEPADIKGFAGAPMNCTIFGFEDQDGVREFLANVDLIVPLGCAESYKVLNPWCYCRSVTEEGSSYLKLNNSVFSAPVEKYTITNTGNNGEPEFEAHDGWHNDTFTHGLCMKEGTSVSFNTTGTSWIYVYLSTCNNSTVKIDGNEMELTEDRTDDYYYRRYIRLVEGAGEHTITCDTYEGEQWPCMFQLEVQNVNGDYYQPQTVGVNIDGINYVLHETVNDQNVTIRTATISSQNASLSGDIVIPEKVSYAKTIWQGNEWKTLDAYDYDVTDMVPPGFEIDEAPGIHRTVGGAFQESQITSISLPATITTIPAGTFNGCKQLKTVTLLEGITTLGAGAFANCTSLEDIYLPETITEMSGYYIFGNCPSLKKVNIPKQVTSLGNGCFALSGIETFIIPENITSIGEVCFGKLYDWDEEYVNKLKSIKICHKSYTDGSFSFPDGIFKDIDGITLIVPEGTKESFYKQVYPWKDFENIIEYKDQNDEHQYNNYRVEIEEEAPAASRRRANSEAEHFTVGFTPSGVDIELPAEIEKNGKKYLVEYKNKPEVMPAEDIVLQAVLKVKGDMDGDGNLSVSDVVQFVNAVMDPSSISDIKMFDMDGDGNVTVTDVVLLVNSAMNN